MEFVFGIFKLFSVISVKNPRITQHAFVTFNAHYISIGNIKLVYWLLYQVSGMDRDCKWKCNSSW